MKKILKLLSIPIGLLALTSCTVNVNFPQTSNSNATPSSSDTSTSTTTVTTTPIVTTTTTTTTSTTKEVTKDDININIPSINSSSDSNETPTIEFDGEQVVIPIEVPEGCTSVVKFKPKDGDDSEYTTTPPSNLGDYTIQVEVTVPGFDTPIIINQDIKIEYSLTSNFTKYENTEAYVKVSTAKEFLDALYNAQIDYTNTISSITENDGYVVRNNVRKNETNWVSAITKGLYIKITDQYSLTQDETFQAGKTYYTREGSGTNDDPYIYSEVVVTVGRTVRANKYYEKEPESYYKIPVDTPWDPDDTVYTASMTYYEDSPYSIVDINQKLNKDSTVHVIEIENDLDLGYNLIKDLNANTSTFENWDKSNRLKGSTDVYCDPDLQAAGISKIKVAKSNNLLIYSKNGSKLTHCGFSVESCYNVAFRNIEMDEIWMWEDSTTTSPTIKVGDYDSFGWAYFKVSFSENIWIDHCTFGKSFDGQIDYSNPYYHSVGTYQKAPFGSDGKNGLFVTYCDFNAGSDDPNGYLYKMMDKIEKEYQVYLADKTGYTYSNKSCRYYFTLRDSGLSFDDVFYGIAIPQKKAFLWGDSGDPYVYNKYLVATLANCTIKNIEDRLPKVRGGMAYVYNVLVDNTEYYPYVSILKDNQSTVQSANSKYKLGAVSQGILAGLDASVYLESVEYKGISTYLKNNDDASDKYPTQNGGYMIKNSILGNVQGSSTGSSNPFASLVSGSLSPNYFAFKVDGEKTTLTEPPFEIDAYDLITNGSLVGYFAENPTGTITQNFNWLQLQ